MKKRIIVIISSNLFVRNYIRTGVLGALRDNYEVVIAAREAVTMRDELEAEEGFLGYFPAAPELEEKHYQHFNIIIFRFQDRSRTFPFRLKRAIGWHLPEEKNRARKNRKLLWRNLFDLGNPRSRMAWKCVLFGNRIVFPVYRLVYERLLRVNPGLRKVIESARADALLYPSNAYDPYGNDAVRIARDNGITSIYLIDNWDNLSSKSVFWARPDFLGVWSEQHAEHAVRIHRFARENVYPIGTPRFGEYLAKRGRAGDSHFSFPYVVFSGCCLPFDETEALRILEREVGDHPEIYGELKVVYRPHPWRQKRRREDRFVEDEFTRVVLDPQVRDEFLAHGEDMSRLAQFQPATDYYPPLIDNALFVCGPLTTFLIETLVFQKAFLGLSYDDGAHLASPHNAFRYYEMYQGIEDHPGVTLVHERENLANQFREVFQETEGRRVDGAAWDAQLNFFLRMDAVPYPERLRAAVDAVMEGGGDVREMPGEGPDPAGLAGADRP